MNAPKPGTNRQAQHLLHTAFYRFVHLPDPEAAARELRQIGGALGLRGSLVVAHEGVNGMVAGAAALVRQFEEAVGSGAVLKGLLRDLCFKRSVCASQPFGRLKVSVKPEIVTLGLPLPAAEPHSALPDAHDASHLLPAAWREMLAQGTAVVLDNRNHFEFRLGHFRGAVDPGVHHFRDLVRFVEQHAPAWRAQGRPVAMYCTGGIRCDKTAPWMRTLGLEIFQLDGGILNYLQHARVHDRDDGHDRAVPLGGAGVLQRDRPGRQRSDPLDDWQGECFVFDRRIALDAHLCEAATTAEQVFDPAHPDEAWRLQRALRLDDAP
ncbi:MAG: rhodanese-like domain-containing protein [Betaproteobacteria bacterium]